MDNADLLFDSVETTMSRFAATLALLGSELDHQKEDRLARSLESNLKYKGKEIVGHIRADDDAKLFFPATVTIRGKNEAGCFLALQNRLVLGWAKGLRAKTVTQVLEFSSIASVSFDTSSVCPLIHIAGTESLTLELVYDESNVISMWLMDILQGTEHD